MKKNICIATRGFPGLGGAAMMIHEYWKVLETKYDVHFLTYPPENYDDSKHDYKIHKLSNVRFPLSLFPFYYLYMTMGIMRLLKLHKKYDFKAIIPQEGSFTALYVAMFGKLTGARIILMDYGHSINIHNDEFWIGNVDHKIYKISPTLYKVYLLLYRKMAFLAIKLSVNVYDEIMVVGVDLDELYKNVLHVPVEKLRYYELGIDENKFSPLTKEENDNAKNKFHITNNEIVISWAGRFSHEKGIDYLLNALVDLIRDCPDIKFNVLFAGGGPMEDTIIKFIKDNKLNTHVKLVGLLNQKEMCSLLGVSDIFLYTATQGGTMSSGVLQAMSCECAVIATDHPRSHKKLLDGKNGIVIPTNDSEAIYSSIKQLLKDRNELENIKLDARKYILEHHSSLSLKRDLDFI